MDQAIGRLGELRGLQDRRIAAYKETTFTDMRAHDLIVQSMVARIVPPTQVPVVVREWHEPGHCEFLQGGKTAWRLFNAVTESLKGRNLDALPRRTQALHGLLDVACNLHRVPN